MKRIFGLADGAEVSAKVQKNGLHGTGSGIDSEQQWFHVVLSTAALRNLRISPGFERAGL